MNTTKKERLVRFVTQAADDLIDKVKNKGWHCFSTNYLREVARCQYGEPFTNTDSPEVYTEVIKRRPDLAKWIEVKKTK